MGGHLIPRRGTGTGHYYNVRVDCQALQELGAKGDGQLQWAGAEEAERSLQEKPSGQVAGDSSEVDCGHNDERECRGSLGAGWGVDSAFGERYMLL